MGLPPGDILPGMCRMPATFSSRSRWLQLADTCRAACAMDSSLVQSICTTSRRPGLAACSWASSGAWPGCLHVATTLRRHGAPEL